MGKEENDVESYLHSQITKLHGTTRKWVSPGRAGVPDRICMLPEGRVFFVEVKTLSGKLSVRQKREMESLAELGCNVHTVYGRQGVDDFIRGLDVTP